MRLRRAGLVATLLVPGGLVVLPAGAQAASGDCAQAGATVICTYAYTGGEQTFVVPGGTTTVHVVAIGARGGN